MSNLMEGQAKIGWVKHAQLLMQKLFLIIQKLSTNISMEVFLAIYLTINWILNQF